MGCECSNCSNTNRKEDNGEITDIKIDEEITTKREDGDIEDVMDWVFGDEQEGVNHQHKHKQMNTALTLTVTSYKTFSPV